LSLRARSIGGLAGSLLCCILGAVMTLGLSACHNREPQGATLNLALALFPDEAQRYQHFAADFEHRYGIRINLVAQSYGDILRALQAEAGTGHGALDIVELDLAMLGEAQPDVIALDRLLSPPVRRLFPQAAWQAATTAGHVYYVPHRLMWQAMIYNRLMVPSPPTNWAELRAFARAHPGKLGLKAALYEGAVCDVMPFVWDAGGSQRAPLAPGSLRGLDFLRSLAPDLNPQSSIFREMSILEAQARGVVWIHFNWPFAMAYLASKGLAPQTDMSAPLPAGPSGSFTVLGGGYLGIPVSAPHRAAAELFLRYLLQASSQRRLSQELGWFGSVPPPPGSPQARLYAGFSAMRDHVRARPTIAGYAELSNRWQRAIRAVLFDDVPPADAFAR
jgi:ABC-type glycerol-3-phosphate transport system substrate-binding protein